MTSPRSRSITGSRAPGGVGTRETLSTGRFQRAWLNRLLTRPHERLLVISDSQKIQVYWPDIAKHILRRAPAGAVHNRKGRPPRTMERVMTEMRAIDRNILKTMKHDEMRERFRVSREVFVPARKAVLDEN